MRSVASTAQSRIKEEQIWKAAYVDAHREGNDSGHRKITEEEGELRTPRNRDVGGSSTNNCCSQMEEMTPEPTTLFHVRGRRGQLAFLWGETQIAYFTQCFSDWQNTFQVRFRARWALNRDLLHHRPARHLSPSRNISRLIDLVYLFRARIDSVKRPCSSLGRLRRYNFVTLQYYQLWWNKDCHY